ncbi:MAG TPA: MBL fold metallo-hydrolase [Myxococcales bacterium]|nr:MBL fold metallo-hydrolase [Myxococcales bacterium]
MRRMVDPPEVERAANGLRVRGHALYLEPKGRPPLGILGHARGAPAVLPERMVATATTIKLIEAALPRALRRSAALPAAYGQAFALGSLRLTFHPAGHVLGSAQVRCQAAGLDLVYAGDIGGMGRRASLTAEALEPLSCETLAIRALYGHPRFVFPPRQELLERASDFVERTLREGQTPVLVAAALGTAQELVRILGGRRTLRLHPTAFRATQVYAEQGAELNGFVRLDSEGDVIVVPPTVRLSRLDLGPHRVCVLSGRALDGLPNIQEALPLSDHAGFDDLVEYVRASGAKRVYTIDGHAEDLAHALRQIGIAALAIREHHQLTLPGV